jgi:hypothetical protein
MGRLPQQLPRGPQLFGLGDNEDYRGVYSTATRFRQRHGIAKGPSAWTHSRYRVGDADRSAGLEERHGLSHLLSSWA